jgi:hypothetical protein
MVLQAGQSANASCRSHQAHIGSRWISSVAAHATDPIIQDRIAPLIFLYAHLTGSSVDTGDPSHSVLLEEVVSILRRLMSAIEIDGSQAASHLLNDISNLQVRHDTFSDHRDI